MALNNDAANDWIIINPYVPGVDRNSSSSFDLMVSTADFYTVRTKGIIFVYDFEITYPTELGLL